MSDESEWQRVMESIGNTTLQLGPHYADQALHSPRHLLFTLARYKFAAKMFPHDRRIRALEVGCNEGLGTMMLAEGGHDVVGVDLDADAIGHANATLAEHSSVSFRQEDVLVADLGRFDAVVSLDVIEHIQRDEEEAFLEALWRHVGPEGFCVVGTPNVSASAYASRASQIGHVNLFSPERLATALSHYFVNVFLFGLNDEVAHTGYYPMMHYVMALGSVPRERPSGPRAGVG